MTLNEPQCFVWGGLHDGWHAPGDKLRLDEVLLAAHHVLMAHGKAVQVIRANAKQKPFVGTAFVASTRMPKTETPADIDAARRAMFDITEPGGFANAWWMDPVLKGCYPADGLKVFGASAPVAAPGDFATMRQPLDFLGVNIYNGLYVTARSDGTPRQVPLEPGYPKTTQDFWPITPSCLYWGPRLLHERYGVPIVITENGHQNADVVSLDGKVHDPQRIDYLQRHLRELKRACSDGVDVRGYFQWCFTDNFEWAMGDAIRVGLVFTDYPTQKRIPKDSAWWYRDVIRTNGEGL
jgi:beta-glucosidase